MPTGLAEREKEEQELNPGQQYEDNLTNFSGAANPNSPDMSGFENSFRNQTADPGQENANIQKAKDGEETAGKNDKSDDKKKGETTASSKTPGGNTRLGKALNFAKKSGPFAPILLIFITSGLFILAISSPGLAIVQISEALKTDLDDALSNTEARSGHIIRAKIKNKAVSKGCSGGSLFRCKYKSMSEKQMNKLRKAGYSFVPESPKKTISGKYQIEALTHRTASGKTEIVGPKEYLKKYNTDPEFRSKANTAYNPKWKNLRDSFAKNVFSKFKVDFKNKLSGRKGQMNKQLNDTVRTGGSTTANINKNRISTDGDTDDVAEDKRSKEDAAKKTLSEQRAGNGGLKSFLGGSLRGVNMLTGGQEGVCMVLKTSELASMASRILQFAQLMRYSSLFFTAADKVKLGEQTHEEMEFLGEKLLHSDMRDEVLNEEGATAGGQLLTELNPFESNDTTELEFQIGSKTNPDLGKNALDSAGIKTAMYGSPAQDKGGAENYKLSTRESQYIVGSSMGWSIDSLVAKMRNSSFGTLDKKTCAIYENPVVKAGGLLLSVAAIVGSGGSAALVAGAKAGIQMVIISYVMSYINGKIADMLSGENLNSETKGVDAGNAWFSGAGATFGTAASSRGISPISTKGEIENMQSLKAASLDMEAKVARYEARSTPLDIMNQYSFLGSIAWKIAPADISGGSGLKAMALAPTQILSSVTKIFAPTAGAAMNTDIKRYEQCKDPTFVGAANDDPGVNLEYADIMCNIRYTNSPTDLNADPERVADWVVDAAQVDPESGEPVTDRNKMKELNEDRASSGQEVGTASTNEDPERNKSDQPLNAYPQSSQRAGDMTVAEVMRPDDDTLAYLGIPLNTPSEKIASYNPGSSTTQLAQATDLAKDKRYFPPPISSDSAALLENPEYDPEKDVRTYAHWFRYCRYDPNGGRSVPIGMLDTDNEDDSVFDSLGTDLDNKYVNDGRECLEANQCEAGQDPNGANWDARARAQNGETTMKKRCRPPQYDIYSIFHLDKVTEEGMEEDDEGESDAGGSDLALGNAQEMAQKLLDNENIILNDESRGAMQKFADTGVAINGCGERFAINPLLSWIMVKNAEKYKVTVNNFGFTEDRHLGCESGGYQHPRGNAVDLNSIEALDGSGTSNLSFGGGELDVITKYTADWMNGLAEKEPTRGRVGQIGCGGFNMLSHPDRSKWEGPDGNLHFNDSCNHLHIEAADRVDILKPHPTS